MYLIFIIDIISEFIVIIHMLSVLFYLYSFHSITICQYFIYNGCNIIGAFWWSTHLYMSNMFMSNYWNAHFWSDAVALLFGLCSCTHLNYTLKRESKSICNWWTWYLSLMYSNKLFSRLFRMDLKHISILAIPFLFSIFASDSFISF